MTPATELRARSQKATENEWSFSKVFDSFGEPAMIGVRLSGSAETGTISLTLAKRDAATGHLRAYITDDALISLRDWLNEKFPPTDGKVRK